MNLNGLPEDVLIGIKNLTEDEQFQKRFANDELLDNLQAQKHNASIEFQQLLLTLHKRTMIGGISFKPVTLALFCYLFSLQSNAICDVQKVTKDDLDIFFYLLQTKDYTHNLDDLFKFSYDYGKRVLGLNFNEMLYIFDKIYQIQLKCYSMFPKNKTGDGKVYYNVDWMLNIISKVKPLTSYTTQQLYTQISISQIYYYYAQFRRMRGDTSIIARNSQEILDEQDSRMIEMVLDRLVQKKVVDSSKKQEYFDIMKKKQEKIQENNNG